MGKSSTEIQSDLERQRNALSARIRRLNGRLRDDAAIAGDELRADIDHVLGEHSAAAEHPKALLAGSAGAGALLGILSANASLPRPHMPGRGDHPGTNGARREEAPTADADRKKRGLLSLATGAAAGSLQGQLGGLMGEAWAGFKAGMKNDSRAVRDSGHRVHTYDDVLAGRSSRTTDPPPEGRVRYLSREEIDPMNSDRTEGETDAELHRREDEEARKVVHDAEVEDLNPREDTAASYGVQGEGALISPTPGNRRAPGERPSERRSGQ